MFNAIYRAICRFLSIRCDTLPFETQLATLEIVSGYENDQSALPDDELTLMRWSRQLRALAEMPQVTSDVRQLNASDFRTKHHNFDREVCDILWSNLRAD